MPPNETIARATSGQGKSATDEKDPPLARRQAVITTSVRRTGVPRGHRSPWRGTTSGHASDVCIVSRVHDAQWSGSRRHEGSNRPHATCGLCEHFARRTPARLILLLGALTMGFLSDTHLGSSDPIFPLCAPASGAGRDRGPEPTGKKVPGPLRHRKPTSTWVDGRGAPPAHAATNSSRAQST